MAFFNIKKQKKEEKYSQKKDFPIEKKEISEQKNFFLNEKKDNFASEKVILQEKTEPKKINLIVLYDEKEILEREFQRENIDFYFLSIGHARYELQYSKKDEQLIEEILEDFYAEEYDEYPEDEEEFDDETDDTNDTGADVHNEFMSDEDAFDYEEGTVEEFFIQDLESFIPIEEVEEPVKTEISRGKMKDKIDLKSVSVENMKPKITRKKLNRTIEMKARFTEEEAATIEYKIKKSGLKKGDFIRKCLLDQEIKEINTEKISDNITALLELKSELGRVGGLLKAFIKPNMNNYNVTADEMRMVKSQLNELEKLKKRIDNEVKKRWQF